MLPMPEFVDYKIGKDPYEGVTSALILDDLELKSEVTPKLTILMSVFHRYSQLQRTLETLCRQTFKNFDILVYDNDDDQHIERVIEQFSPYLNIQLFKKTTGIRRFDPSISFRELLPHARGEVICLMQPECMLYPEATNWLYYGHDLVKEEHNRHDVIKYNIKDNFPVPVSNWKANTCVTLKTLWLDKDMQKDLDAFNWHDNIRNLYYLLDFWEGRRGLSGFSNEKWATYDHFIWWVVFSFKRDDPILANLPDVYGHASIDFYLINYRETMGYIDIMPYLPMAIHQDHHRMSVAPIGEQELVSKESMLKFKDKNGK